MSQSITVEDDVWIGYDALILPGGGFTIGKGSVIGARSIVTKDVPPYSVFVGNRVIKRRFGESVINAVKDIDYSSINHTCHDRYKDFCQIELSEDNVEEMVEIFRTAK